MIYIDPPYNTGKEFIYPDKFQDNLDTYLKYTGQKDDEGFKVSSNTESSGRYHTNWLNMMYPRLKLARNQLCEDGAIFISINEIEVANLRKICDDIFGEENFVAEIVWQNKEGGGGSDSALFRIKHEYIVVYCKNIDTLQILGTPVSNIDRYTSADVHKSERGPYYLQKLNQASIQYSASLDYPIASPDGMELYPEQGNKRACWRWSKQKVEWGLQNDFIEFKKDREGNWQVYTKQYLYADNEGKRITRTNPPLGVIDDYSTTNASKKMEILLGPSIFSYSKPTDLLEYLINRILTEDEDAIILDFFAGSCATAHATLNLNAQGEGNRRFIMVQLPEPTFEIKDGKKVPKKGYEEAFKAGYKTIADIGKERIRRAAVKIKEENPEYEGDLGFKVFKLDSSNIRAWNPDRNDLEQTLLDHMVHLVKGRSEEDVLYELLLKRGVDLTVPIEEKTITGKTVYSIGYGVLFACLDTAISREEVEDLATGIIDWHKELEPVGDTQVVFRDSAFANDIAKTNMTAILEQHGIAHVRSL